MPAIAVVGAGARLGQSIAEAFGRSNGFAVALIARDEDKLAGFTARLESRGITAAGFAADVRDPDGLTAAMERATARFGAIEVLEYSVPPAQLGSGGFAGALDVTVENLRPQVESICYGAVTATRAVLPGMVAAGTGTLLFTTGASSVEPQAVFGSAGIAGAALRNWALNLNGVLAGTGVYAGHVAIGSWIAGTPAPAGAPTLEPDDIAAVYWALHTTRDRAEQLVTA